MNNSNQTYPTLRLVQKLWDNPKEIYDLMNPNHKLKLYGLLNVKNFENKDSEWDWDSKISVPIIITKQLLFPGGRRTRGLTLIGDENETNGNNIESVNIVVSRINTNRGLSLKIAPLKIPFGRSPKSILKKISD